MTACNLNELSLAGITGAFVLMCLLIITTCVMHFSNFGTGNEPLPERVSEHERRHERQIGELSIVIGTPVRGPRGIRSTTTGDGSTTSGRAVQRIEDSRGNTFTRLR